MTSSDILKQLESLGLASIKNVLLKHGVKEPLYGVKVEELKKIQKVTKQNNSLALELYASGVYDAMYLAGLIAEPEKMTKKDLQKWVKDANSSALCAYTVAWVAAESKYGMELSQEWIESANENIASAGWSTLTSLVAITKDEELDIPVLKQLLTKLPKTIHTSHNQVKSAMNGFITAVGIYVKELHELAKQTAEKIGKLTIDVGDTACKVPYAIDYIEKAESKNSIGKKKKSARC
ncbi:MAG: alkylation repair enzyme [Flavipsychrobacter sp.]|nr:alkylation repair enzyme [Flavipsychrobacter sp.]